MAELKVYTMEEVSEILSISIKTVYKYIKEGSLPAVRVENTGESQRTG